MTRIRRRSLLQWLAAGLLMPWHALAAIRSQPGLASMPKDIQHDAIEIVAPAWAQDGSSIQVEIMSRLPATEAIALYAEQNPVPLLGNFSFSHGAMPYLITHIRLMQSQSLKVVVRANGHYYHASRYIAVKQLVDKDGVNE